MSYICAEDYLDSATRSVSSEDAQFPASNLYDQSIRGRVWRSAGFFEITSANKGIVFQETDGVNLTANIAEGTYSSMSAFLTAIKTALEDAGAQTYTVTQNASTKKISIASGGAFFELIWTNASSTAADVIGFSTAADDTGALTYTADNIRIHSYEYLKWDLGATSNPDIFIAVGKKNQAIKISESATIRLQGNLTDAWTSPAYDQAITYDELALLKLKTSTDAGLHSTGLRYWRLKITDRENANGYVELSNVYLGEYYSPSQGKIGFPFTITKQDYSASTQFKYGAKSYSRNDRGESFSFDWFPLTVAEKEEFDSIANNLGDSKPFYMVFDPNTYFGSSVNYNVRYVRFSQPLTLALTLPNTFESSWSLEEML